MISFLCKQLCGVIIFKRFFGVSSNLSHLSGVVETCGIFSIDEKEFEEFSTVSKY
jgi:hypothetical protein